MANVFANTHWALDTATADWTEPIKIKNMKWVPSAEADDLTILDGNDEVILDVNAAGAGEANAVYMDFEGGKWFKGFNLSVIDGGSLYVFIA